jgi:hypothetical protein
MFAVILLTDAHYEQIGRIIDLYFCPVSEKREYKVILENGTVVYCEADDLIPVLL